MLEPLDICVMLGGPSEEREVSLQSGAAVADALRSLDHRVSEIDPVDGEFRLPPKTDVVFLALHGTYGEDGTVQAKLDALGVPYTGCSEAVSRLAFDKVAAKRACSRDGLATAKDCVVDALGAGLPDGLELPLVLKPVCQGSSIRLEFVDSGDAWPSGLAKSLEGGGRVLVEELIGGREVTVGVVGGQLLPVVEITPKRGAYDYANKYTTGATEYTCPAPFDAEATHRIQHAGEQALAAIGGGKFETTLREQFGLDKPLYVQYAKWAAKLVQGDFGQSLEYQKPVSEIVSERLLMTIILAGTTALFSWALSIPIGIYSAVRQHSVEDYTITFIGFLGLAVPDFLLALWLLWATFTYFPDHGIGGLFSPEYIEAPWSFGRLMDLMSHLWIAAFVVGTAGTEAHAADNWPQWGGPNRDLVWRETGIVKTLPTKGLLPRVWSTPVGEGYSGPAVANGRVYITDFLREKRVERIHALDAGTGKILPYLDIPFQHASPRVLKAMKRPAHQEKTVDRIRAWRAAQPDPSSPPRPGKPSVAPRDQFVSSAAEY